MKWEIAQKLENKQDLQKKLLEIRNINEDEIDNFLNPIKTDDLVKQLSNEIKAELQLAKNIIDETIKNQFPIIIHGDYDADGVCATTILSFTLSEVLGYKKVFTFIPNRFKNSYGITKSSIDACWQKITEDTKDLSNALLISVDTGITAVSEVEYAKQKGFKVIITDHHQKPSKLPQAYCIVWTDKLVGAGVSWLLGQYLGLRDKGMLGLAALATVTDLQPILGINRSIVKEGLYALNQNPPVGIKALLEVSGRKGSEITTYDLGWVLGPRLNASGRIGDASVALELLQSTDYERATQLANTLNQTNSSRQDKTEEMYGIVESLDKENLPKIIFSVNDEYHEGIIGLIASKLVSEYYRPAIVISLNGEVGKGSVRSVQGIDIIAFLRKFETLFESLGGHHTAAGFTIKKENIESLKTSLLEASVDYIPDDKLIPFLEIDLEIPVEIVDLEFIEIVNSLKPFGIGNKTPLFVSRNLGIVGLSAVGKNKNHLSIKLFKGSKYFKGIIFNQAESFGHLKIGDVVDIVFSAEKNEFNGSTYVNLLIKDIKFSNH